MSNLSRNWWLIVLRGVAAILFGIAAFVWPGLTLLILITVFGFYALIDGFIAIFTGLRHTKDSPRWWVFLVEGLFGIAIGAVALLWPGVTTLAILAMIAAWAIITGILEIAAAIRLRREITNEWLLAITGILSVGMGIVLIVQPLTGSLAIIWIIGAYALISGIVWISLGLRLRSREMSTRSPEFFSPTEKGLHTR
jgi:uncharacterized membrane protein HdeD (DUF308 family)